MPYNVLQPSYPAYSHAPSHSTRCAVRGVRYAVRGARRVVRGTRMLPFSATVHYDVQAKVLRPYVQAPSPLLKTSVST